MYIGEEQELLGSLFLMVKKCHLMVLKEEGKLRAYALKGYVVLTRKIPSSHVYLAGMSMPSFSSKPA